MQRVPGHYERPPARTRRWRLRLAGPILTGLLLGMLAPLAGRLGREPAKFVDLAEVTRPSRSEGQARGPALRVAISSIISPGETRLLYKGLVEYVGEKSGRRVILKQRRTYAEANALLARGEVDLAFLCSGQYVVAHDRFGSRLLAAPVVHGETVYRSYIIVSARSSITSFEQLRDRKFGFVDPLSNTGYLVPAYWLAREGESPDSFFASYLYTDSHDNSIQAVADGLLDGAAVDSLIYESLRKRRPDVVARTRVIARSEPFGMPPVVVPAELDPGLEATLREILLSMHQDPRGEAILKKLSIERFAPGDDAAYDEIRRMREFVAQPMERATFPPGPGR